MFFPCSKSRSGGMLVLPCLEGVESTYTAVSASCSWLDSHSVWKKLKLRHSGSELGDRQSISCKCHYTILHTKCPASTSLYVHDSNVSSWQASVELYFQIFTWLHVRSHWHHSDPQHSPACTRAEAFLSSQLLVLNMNFLHVHRTVPTKSHPKCLDLEKQLMWNHQQS